MSICLSYQDDEGLARDEGPEHAGDGRGHHHLHEADLVVGLALQQRGEGGGGSNGGEEHEEDAGQHLEVQRVLEVGQVEGKPLRHIAFDAWGGRGEE